MKIIVLYLITLALFLVVDLLWLGVIARGLYREQLGHLMAPQTNWPIAITFYLLFVGGLIYFATWPALRTDAPWQALLNGALFGFFTYATYELTNKAVIDRWPNLIVPVDILWGTVLGAVVSWSAFQVFQLIYR